LVNLYIVNGCRVPGAANAQALGLAEKKSAQEIIALIAQILIAFAGGLWAVFTYLFPADKPAAVSQPPAVTSSSGGIAAEHDISHSKINIGQLPPPTPGATGR
jgi:hypothetical protein